MENISFVIWMVCYPPLYGLSCFLAAKTRKIYGEEKPTETAQLFSAIINLAIWIFVGRNLYV